MLSYEHQPSTSTLVADCAPRRPAPSRSSGGDRPQLTATLLEGKNFPKAQSRDVQSEKAIIIEFSALPLKRIGELQRRNGRGTSRWKSSSWTTHTRLVPRVTRANPRLIHPHALGFELGNGGFNRVVSFYFNPVTSTCRSVG